ncbi:MAG: ATP-binding cassette domain-containing protein [Thaumarchaeota archaeon]|nr:ATP-binding cassette domain-containing protein [Nitrososphaerota archaeon]
MSEIITVKDLVEVYSDGTKAIQRISFDVDEGQFFGFLGPNGAGKSTTIKVLTTLLRKTSGAVTVAGYDLDKDPKEIRKLIGVQSQETVVDGDLTGKENMILQGNLHQMRGRSLEERVDELLKLVELSDVAKKRAAFYSGGMKKRLDLASALVHRPKLLFLDEPTTGLDPQSRATMWTYLGKLNKDEGITIFLTTQYMEEADKLCRQVSIIDRGQIVASGSPSELKQEIGADAITLSFAEDDERNGGAKAKARELLAAIPGVGNIVDSDSGMTVYAKDASSMIVDIVRAFDANQLHLSSINLSRPSLDDVFLKHTGHRIRTEELVKPPSGMRFRRGRR